ncbi:MAG: heme exporter protein CcmD [Pseudomonadota bacterium]
MEIVLDMGAHGRFIWPAYAAFVVIIGGLYWWIAASNARARAKLDELERDR